VCRRSGLADPWSIASAIGITVMDLGLVSFKQQATSLTAGLG
jgi:hypothetical protein